MSPALRRLLAQISDAFTEAVQAGLTTPEAVSAIFAQTRPIVQHSTDPADPKDVVEYMDLCWTAIMEKLLRDIAAGDL
jgi:hypothetical protein